MTVWRIREKSLWSSTTAILHANAKVWVQLTIVFNTRTHWLHSGQTPRLLHLLLKFLGWRCSFWSWLLKIRKDLCRVVWFCLIYIIFIIFYEITSIHSFIYLALNSSVTGIGFFFFFFFKKEFFLLFLLRNQYTLEQVQR